MRANLLSTFIAMFMAVGHTAWAQEAERISDESLASAIYTSGLAGFKSRLSPPDGSVVKISNGVVYISNDSKAALASGRRLTLVREKEVIVHPQTGEKLGAITETAGDVKVLSATGKLITAAIEKGARIALGDRIGGELAKTPRVAMAAMFSLSSWESAKALGSIYEKLSGWSHVLWIPHYAMERFVYDENIRGREDLVTEDSFRSLRKSLKADFLIVLEVKEEKDSILIDGALYELLKGASPVALSKGLSPKVGGEPGAAPSKTRRPRQIVKPAPAPIAPIESPAPAKRKAQAKAETKKSGPAPSIKPGPRERKIKSFDKNISALLVDDLDGDGENEIVVGFVNQVAVFKRNKDGITKVWEKVFKSSEQVTGLGAGDFNGNGNVEVYVNKVTASSKIESLVFERDGGSYQVVMDKLRILFYPGGDGKLYGQGQEKNRRLKESVDQLAWAGSGFTKKRFVDLPSKKRLSGIAVFDLDGDGVTDISGYGANRAFVYHSSAAGRWASPLGKYGGSNIAMEIPVESRLYTSEDDEKKQYQEFIGPPILSTSPDGRLNIFAIRNEAPFPFVPRPTHTKAQVIVLEYTGAVYSKRSETTVTPGAVHGYALIDEGAPNLILVARNYFSLFGAEKSELILLDLNQF